MYQLKGNCRENLGGLEEAIENYSKVLELEPTNQLTLLKRANARYNSKDYKNASIDF